MIYKKNFSKKNFFKIFFKDYISTLEQKLKNIDLDKLYIAAELILKTIKKNKCIFVCGNGGSGAIADHYICDFFKQLSKYTNLKAKIRSLNSDHYLISAISNDISYEDVFSVQAERYLVTGDILILISSSWFGWMVGLGIATFPSLSICNSVVWYDRQTSKNQIHEKQPDKKFGKIPFTKQKIEKEINEKEMSMNSNKKS